MSSLLKYRLLEDLYVFDVPKIESLEYMTLTKKEIDEVVSVAHKAGEIYEYSQEDGAMYGPSGTVGIDGTPDPAIWEPYSEQDGEVGVVCELYAPNGTPIQGTLDRLRGVAVVSSASIKEDGTLELDYEGTTEVWWNDQTTIQEAGERLYADIDGCVWRESQLMLEPIPARILEAKLDEQVPPNSFDSEGGHCD